MFNATVKNGEGMIVRKGDTVTDFRGEDWVFEGVSALPVPGKSAKVWVSWDGSNREFYAQVFNLVVDPS